ncbi:MAG: methyltransferase domain-containing protein [Pedobacter sp.]|nr:MAG: methyltransferase domain-containing protein [Pedobacter sp.]
MSIFQFKQFQVDQTDCAMKINTDGVLLAAMVQAAQPQHILDIGTGTGVIAMMLAQRFESAQIDGVEIEIQASERAALNFKGSSYAHRLKAFHSAIESFESPVTYDLIVTNPPFFVNDLKNPEPKKGIARHADTDFFEELIKKVFQLLAPEGEFWVILPVKQAQHLVQIAARHRLYQVYQTNIHSDKNKPLIRMVIALAKQAKSFNPMEFYIYEEEKVHTEAYQELLKDFFLAF